VYLRNFVIRRFEEADVERNAAVKQARLTFVIVGAGLVGVELQGELQEFAHQAVRNYVHIDPRQMRFELLEHGPRIMREMDEVLAEYAAEVFKGRGIRVRTSTPVELIEPGKVHLKGGEVIEASTIVVATGVTPSPLVKSIEKLQHGEKGHIKVDATMRSVSHRNIWALGDCAEIPGPDGKPYPPLAQHALREARHLAKNLLADLKGQPTKPFIYKSKGTLAALGHYKGVGRVFKFRLKGFTAWTVWRAYYLIQMPRMSRRIRIMMDWLVAITFGYDIVEVNFDRDVSSGPRYPVPRQQQPVPTADEKHDSQPANV
jgi:NADH:ubiquinone reductase (H+-translocating)